MKKEMRRTNRKISEDEALKIVEKGEYGILSTVNESNNPYGIPISYVLIDNYIYLHCAMQGSKLDNINYNNNVCFVIVGKTQPIYDKQFTTYYESVIIFGSATIVDDVAEKTMSLTKLCTKYLPNDMDKLDNALKMSMDRTCIIKIKIEKITGKAKKPIV